MKESRRHRAAYAHSSLVEGSGFSANSVMTAIKSARQIVGIMVRTPLDSCSCGPDDLRRSACYELLDSI
jgi:hypothetical protein